MTSDIIFETIEHKIRKQNGFQIRITWDESMFSEISKTYFRKAAQILVDIIETKTVHDVRCFEKKDVSLSHSSTSFFTVPYEMLYYAYQKFAQKSDVTKLFFQSCLPNENPFQDNSVCVLSSAQIKVLKIKTENRHFLSDITVDFSETRYDLVAVCLHELTETMGRIGGFQDNQQAYHSLFDFTLFKGVDTRSEQYEENSFCSIDAGRTSLAYFNVQKNGDAMDWKTEMYPNDCFSVFEVADIQKHLSFIDLILLESLGFVICPLSFEYLNNETNDITIARNQQVNIECVFKDIIGVKFEISPDLPTGLSFEDGKIIGCAESTSSKTKYQVSMSSGSFQKVHHFFLQVTSPKIQNNQEISSEEEENLEKPTIGTAAIVGIVLACLLLLAIIVTVSVLYAKKKRASNMN